MPSKLPARRKPSGRPRKEKKAATSSPTVAGSVTDPHPATRSGEITRAELLQILVDTLRAPPNAAHLDNPLCELRMGKDGPYAVFMDKAKVHERICKMLGADEKEAPAGKSNANTSIDAILTPERLAALQARRREAVLRRNPVAAISNQ